LLHIELWSRAATTNRKTADYGKLAHAG
jgi:hypothetical protein